MADNKSRAIRVVSILLVAVGAGFVMQNMQRAQTGQQALTEVAQEPKAIENLAAGSEAALVVPDTKPVLAVVQPAPMPVTKPAPAPAVMAAAEATEPTPPPVVAAAPPLPVTTLEAPIQAEVADACAITLDLMPDANAMIGLTLLAPCHINERVVIKHAGLAVSGLTTANGALFTGIPAMEPQALIEVLFSDGDTFDATIEMPEVADLRRFAVQWQANDAFQLHAFELGAAYGDAGHVSGADPHRPAAGAPAKGGFLTLLGDSTTETPMLAEVYTFPADAASLPEVVIEAAVTDSTCGRELLGETISSTGGLVEKTDLTVAMPECDAVGGYLVLKNLVSDLNVASAG
jgi:hypothetical protein